MFRRLVVMLAGGAGLMGAASPSEAFWERSQVIRCADAATPAELQRYRCWELNAYADPGWPQLRAADVVIEERVPVVSVPAPIRRGAVYKW